MADIRTLPFPDGQFAAVLCLGGPLTHLPELNDRERAVDELMRVAAPGGLVVLSGVGYLAVLRTIMAKCSHELIDGSLAAFFTDGNSPGSQACSGTGSARRNCANLAEAHGLTTLDMAGCQSLSTGLEEATNQLREDEEKWQRWFEILLATASEPAVVDMAGHILYIGQKES